MKVIDLSTCKTLLGITDTSKDSQISAQIDIIDAKVKQICKNNFNLQAYGKFTAGSKVVYLYAVGRGCNRTWSPALIDSMVRDMPIGTMVEGDPITAVGRIDETYYTGYAETDKNVPYFTLNEEATETGEFYFYAGINYAYQSVIAKGVMWLINQTNQYVNDTAWKSKSSGPLSVTRSDADNKIEGRSGMPAWFVKGLPRYHG